MLRTYLAAQSAARGKSIFSSPKRHRSPAFHTSSAHRSVIEPLESRHLLSATVIQVNTTADAIDPNDAFISLREAVLMANASPEDNEIRLPAGIYGLNISGANEDNGLNGDLDIKNNGSIRIVGADKSATRITAIGLLNVGTLEGDRIVDVFPGAHLEIANVTLSHGAPPQSTGDSASRSGGGIRLTNADLVLTDSDIFQSKSLRGGAVYVDGASVASLERVTLRGNESSDGGAIFNAGSLEMSESIISDNEAVSRGGGITNTGQMLIQQGSVEQNLAFGNGGGIFNAATATIVGTHLVHNTTFRDGGGIASTGTSTMTDVQMSNNTSRGGGGAIWNQGAMFLEHLDATSNSAPTTLGGAIFNWGSLEIRNSEFAQNHAGLDGGAIFNESSAELLIERTRLESNVAVFDGGAIRNYGTLTVKASQLLENRADSSGGGISSVGILRVADSTIAGNRSGLGAGISADGLSEIASSTVSGNLASLMGGGLDLGGSATLLNSTVSGNQSSDKGGGILNRGQLLVSHSTITRNRASAAGNGGGIYLEAPSANRYLTLDQSIVAGNLGGTLQNLLPSDIVRQNATFAVSGRFSLVGDPLTAPTLANGVNGNIVGNGSGGLLDINTVLNTTLAENGGPTLTHALLYTSPALNAGDPAFDPNQFDPPLEFDQRGAPYARVVGDRLDIGAFELTDPLPVDGVITVTTFDDIVAVDGLWSLREAVLWANAHSEDNEIVLVAGTYSLTRQGTNEDAGLTGDLDVVNNGSLRIVGAGRDNTTIDAAGLYNAELGYGDRIFDVLAGADVEIEAVKLTGGNMASEAALFPADGGAIRNAGVLSLLNAAATQNTALVGGAISNSADAELVITGSTLSHNTALDNGGAISNPFSGLITISDSKLVSNHAGSRGGAIYSFGDGTVSDSTISENTANYEGGGLFVRGEFELVNTNFTGNDAGLYGGGIFASSYAGLTITGGNISENTAQFGGGIYKRFGSLQVESVLLGENAASEAGGAVYSRGSDTPGYIHRSTFTSVTLSGNLANTGGAIYHDEGELEITSSLIHDNEAIHAGGLYATGPATVSIISSTISQNTATDGRGGGAYFWDHSLSTSIQDTDFIGNAAAIGGGLYVADGTLVMHGGSFVDNTANEGGAIWHVNNHLLLPTPYQVSVVVEDVNFSNNSAASRGGAIYTRSGFIEVRGGEFKGNSANQGGAVLMSGYAGPGEFAYSGVLLDRVELSENVATGDGGAIANLGSLLIVDSSTLNDNHADGRGGAVYSNTDVRILNSTISGNSASLAGGGVYATYAQVHNSTIALNRADADGNGIDAGGGLALAGPLAALIENSIIAGNVTGETNTDTPSDIALCGAPLTTSSSYNVVGDPNSAGGLANGVNGNIVGDGSGGVLDINTVLDTTLADNGGPTLTHVLLAASPAVDAGDPDFDSAAVPFDQRGAGYARVTGDRVDIGAFEFGSEFENVVAGRQVFYNNSSYDGENTAINSFDIFAVDPTKQALLPDGSLADASNITSYSRGINGIMFDLAGSHPDISADDFIFRVGATNDPGSWAAAPAPLAIQVLAGQGVGGADRVMITWPDGAIKNTYLQVIVAANDDTGLAEPDVFFFGNRVGDSFSTQPPAAFVTSAADELAARNAMPKSSLDVANPFDFDKSRTISSADMLIARNNPGILPRIQIAPPAEAAPLVAAVPLAVVSGQLPAASVSTTSDGAHNALASGLARHASSREAIATAADHVTAPASVARMARAEAVDKVISAAWSSPSETAHSSDDSLGSQEDDLDNLIGALLPSLN